MTGPQNPTNVNREKGHDRSQNDQRQMGVATLKGGRNKQSLATRTTMQTTQVKDESILTIEKSLFTRTTTHADQVNDNGGKRSK